MFQWEQGYNRAPIGHRQPRPIDIPAAELSPFDRALRQEDEGIDSKIVFCRGCQQLGTVGERFFDSCGLCLPAYAATTGKDEFNGQTSSVADCVVQRGHLSGARDRGLSRRLF